MEEERRSFKVVLRLPSKGRKASAEIKVQEETSSPSPSVSAEKKLEKGIEDCDTQSGSSRHCIRSRPKVKRVFHATKDDQEQQLKVSLPQETKDDQEKQPKVEKVPKETKDDQEQQPNVKKVFKDAKDDQEQQPNVKKVAQETNDDQEERKPIKDTEIREAGKKTDGLDDEKPKNFRLDETEAKGNRKRGFTLALSREQIEEDFLELLGPKPPSRRSNKRSRASQEMLKELFPGSWLESLID